MSFLGQEEQLRVFQDRFRFIYTGLFIAMILLLARLTYLQIFVGEHMRRTAEENRIKHVKIPAPRGMIFDRNRRLLIDNQPAFDLEITPQYLRESGQSKQVVQLLSTLLDMPANEIQDKLDKSRRQQAFIPVKIKTDLTRDEVAKIETWRLSMPGVAVEMEIQRTNVYGDIASHALGYISRVTQNDLPQLAKSERKYALNDTIGRFGIEKELEQLLRGEDGFEMIEVDALGRRLRERNAGRVLAANTIQEPVPGQNLILTIDQDLQLAAVRAFGAKAGGVVALNPKNGEILAMVSRPSFNPTDFSRGISSSLWTELLENIDKPLRDKTLQDHYPPGSTYKIMTAIAALEEGLITPETRVTCTGSINYGRTFHCHKKGGHGSVDLYNAIAQSCDIFFYRIAQKLKSVDDLAKWAFHFGLGERTGVPLSNEAPGLIPTEEWKLKLTKTPWFPGETLSVAIGQGDVRTTVLQLANLYATLANGGILYRPHFLKAVETHDGKLVEEILPEIQDRTSLKPTTVEAVKKGLWAVVNAPYGTAQSQKIPGISFAGKTGTSQVKSIDKNKIYAKCDGLPYKDRHHGLFVGFAPMENPEIVVAVIAEHACSGSGGAAPIAREIVKTYLQKLYPEKYGEKALAEARKNATSTPPVEKKKEEEGE